jgi:hypothetical protein
MIIEIIDLLLGILFLLFLLLAAVVVRRLIIQREGGTIPCGLRLHSARGTGHSWTHGFCRFDAGELQWFRLFSLSPRPRRAFSRNRLTIRSRRVPHGAEVIAVPQAAVVLVCDLRTFSGATREVELAIPEAAVTGFLAWLESAPPGSYMDRHH